MGRNTNTNGEFFRRDFFNKWAPHLENLEYDPDKHDDRMSPIMWDHSGDDPVAVGMLRTDRDNEIDHFRDTMFGRSSDPKFLGQVDVGHYASDPLYAMAARRAGVNKFNSANDIQRAINWLTQRDEMDA